MSEEKEMPKGWVETTLGEVCVKATIVQRRNVDLKEEFLYLDIGSIDNTSNKIISHKKYVWEDAPSRAQQIVFQNDILFSTVRTYLRNIARIDTNLFDGQIASSGFTIIRGNPIAMNPKFLFYLSLSHNFLQPLNELQTGTSYPAVRDSDVFSQIFYLPPLPEQHRIVSKIEELFSSLDKGVERLKTAQAQLKVYRQAVLKWAFEGKLTNKEVKEGELPEGWVLEQLGNHVKVKNGYAFKSEWYTSSGIPIVRISNIGEGYVDLNGTVKIHPKNEYDSFVIEKGDILVAMSGATTGKFGRYKSTEKAYQNQRVGNFRIINPKIIMQDYLFYLIGSLKEQILKDAYGGAQPNISAKKIEEIIVAIAPLSEQHLIVSEIESRLSVCDKIEESISTSLAQAEALRQSILKKAFEGKLVPQDPNDEPASVLLERIRAERAQNKPAKTAKKSKSSSKSQKLSSRP